MSPSQLDYRYQDIFDESGIATAFVAPGDLSGEGKFIHVNAAMCTLLGYTEDELCGMTINGVTHPEDHDPNLQLRQGLTERELNNFQVEKRLIHKSGRVVWINLNVTAVRDENGDYLYDIGQHQDITDLKLAEEQMRESETRFRDFAEASADWFWEMDALLRFVYMSPSVERIVGAPPEWHYGKTRRELLGAKYDPEVWEAHLVDLKAHRPFRNFEYFRTGDKGVKPIWIRTSGAPIYDENGNFAGYRGSASDISERKHIEQQLQQAQKLEAIGQLTGGIAHDFNNLLAVILGNAELLGDVLGEDEQLAAVNRAAGRGAELTQRLLAFSRRQTLQPQSIDLVELIPSMEMLLQRTLGEQIKILTHVPDKAWPVFADPGQLENALLNLAINARDAMAGGGTLEIRCSNVELNDGDLRVSDEIEAGDYVRIAVRDTGTGMTTEVLEHAFDPFYTTKEVGKGSGLGLSMVHGFARQSGGDVVIDSKERKGTEISLYLPRGNGERLTKTPEGEESLGMGNSETVLIVEDDPDVRAFTATTLERLGYHVMNAADANTAMRKLEDRPGNVDLLLCDVVLPGGMSGLEFADMARGLYPELKLVFMSGYAAELYDRDRVPGFSSQLLNKPFKRAELADAIREALA